ncbi:hypothetical protein [Vibrio mediterranei]|uniref:hypothetical protein n=1 Tax=Vibrio mediterranei TaxID=689 RepID=UPI004068732D
MIKILITLTTLLAAWANAGSFDFSAIKEQVRSKAPVRVTNGISPGNGFTSELGSTGLASGVNDDVMNYVQHVVDERLAGLEGGGQETHGFWNVTTTKTYGYCTGNGVTPVTHGDVCALGTTRYWRVGRHYANYSDCTNYNAACE